ncbi:MAG: hypothetical protein ABDH31_00150 [Chlorobiota bacterium]
MMHPSLRRVELYFVLYLIALFLLLDPAPRATDRPRTPVLDEPAAVEFSLQPTELRCIIVDSSGRRFLRHYDSVAELRYSRPLGSARLSLQLDSAGHTIWRSEASDVAPILAEHSPQERRFRILWRFPWWRPVLPLGEHVYTLWLLLRHSGPAGHFTERLSAALRISVLAHPQAGTQPEPAPPAIASQPAPPPPLLLVAPDTVLETAPYSSWELDILVYGASLPADLAAPPEIQVTSSAGGTATVIRYTDNAVRLGGVAPREGTMDIRLTLLRRDGQRSSVSLSVTARALPNPEVPSELYPERTYTINPALRLRGQRTRAELWDGNRLWASSTGTPLSISPQLADTGTTLLLRRFVNDRLVDEFRLPIRDFPAPEVVEVLAEGSTLVARTRCFGTVRNEPNRCELRCRDGAVRELYGNRRRYTVEPYGVVTEQSFVIESASPATGVEFSVLDAAGRATYWRGRPRSR